LFKSNNLQNETNWHPLCNARNGKSVGYHNVAENVAEEWNHVEKKLSCLPAADDEKAAYRDCAMPLRQVRLEGLTAHGRIRKLQTADRAMASALALLVLATTTLRITSAGQSDEGVRLRHTAVYVGNFELPVAPTAPPDSSDTGSSDKQPQDLQRRSRQVQAYLAATLGDTLRKQGYATSRSQTLPRNGILLAGVFAEPDQKNRVRRALLDSESPRPKFLLYVGGFDQDSVNQPLYLESVVQEPDPNYGPVITLNSYIPTAKYEIKKDLTEDEVRSICGKRSLLAVLCRRDAAARGAAILPAG
jgi:hypothetical protein